MHSAPSNKRSLETPGTMGVIDRLDLIAAQSDQVITRLQLEELKATEADTEARENAVYEIAFNCVFKDTSYPFPKNKHITIIRLLRLLDKTTTNRAIKSGIAESVGYGTNIRSDVAEMLERYSMPVSRQLVDEVNMKCFEVIMRNHGTMEAIMFMKRNRLDPGSCKHVLVEMCLDDSRSILNSRLRGDPRPDDHEFLNGLSAESIEAQWQKAERAANRYL